VKHARCARFAPVERKAEFFAQFAPFYYLSGLAQFEAQAQTGCVSSRGLFKAILRPASSGPFFDP
jgi:hypothetical protein